ncbi:MAG TPA: sulfotransferase [Candidatus Elarobacter sp.]|nr:sulfotransferase [Dongiaceae bacterium]HZW54599.1 sulfotransferase [Candidatus Elarobacter sp.]
MSSKFRLVMIGAMYENGGNTTHRFLDGHPQMFVYPFESQIGTRLVNDHLSSLFPVKYRWPAFALDATPYQDYKAIIDEEGKVRARTPHVSKFRHEPFDMSDDERCAIYERIVGELGRSRAHNAEAFFRATFEAWKDYAGSGREQVYVGYSPIIGVDADKILGDLPDAHVVHVVRNPWSAYADTKKRPVPLALEHYMLGWTLNQYQALLFQKKFPDRMHVLRIEDVLHDPHAALGRLCERLGLETADSLGYPSWNGKRLHEVYPWGTIRKATPEANAATAAELTPAERDEIRARAWPYLEPFGYGGFIR